MIHKRMEAKVQNLEIASDCELAPQQAEKTRVIKAHYDALDICKKDLEQMIRELGAEYSQEVKHIQTVPGFKEELSALQVISETGADMTVFDSAGKLCSWAELVLANNESAGKKYSTCISKGGRYLKPFLVQIANAIVKSEIYPEFRTNSRSAVNTEKQLSLFVSDYSFLFTKYSQNKNITILFYKD